MGIFLRAVRRPVTRVRRTIVVLVTALAALAASTLAYGDGIDISHWQGTISWTRVDAAGVQFAFMKATEGSTYTDPTMAANWTAARRVGIYRGVYHFARPGQSTATVQARYFVSKTGAHFKEAGSLPPVLDLEDRGGLGVTALRAWTTTWLRTVESLTGRTPIVYVSPSFWETYLGNSAAFHHYPLWVAHYGVTAPRVPGGWPTWTFWQRTSSGRVSGIAGNVDMNRFNGSNARLAVLANSSGGSTDPVPPGPTVPAGVPTTLTLTPSRTSVAIAGAVSFSGRLVTTGTTPAPVAAQTVELWGQSAGTTTWSRVGSAPTDGTGHWSATLRIPRSTSYRARFVGNATYAGSTSTPAVRVSTPPRTATTVDLHKTASLVRKGRPLMLYGHVTAGGQALVGRPVRYFKKPLHRGSWDYVRTSRSVAPTGWHSTTIRPRRSMLWKAVAVGSLRYGPDTSTTVTVRVR